MLKLTGVLITINVNKKMAPFAKLGIYLQRQINIQKAVRVISFNYNNRLVIHQRKYKLNRTTSL